MKDSDWLIIVAVLGFIFLVGRSQHQSSSFSNEEQVTWTDYKGRERKMTIHRSARYG